MKKEKEIRFVQHSTLEISMPSIMHKYQLIAIHFLVIFLHYIKERTNAKEEYSP